VLYDGLEITRSRISSIGGSDLSPISVGAHVWARNDSRWHWQGVNNVYDLQWAPGVSYREVRLRDEVEHPATRLDRWRCRRGSSPSFIANMFNRCYDFSKGLLASNLVLPALDYCLKCSHFFNVLDASAASA